MESDESCFLFVKEATVSCPVAIFMAIKVLRVSLHDNILFLFGKWFIRKIYMLT